MTWDREQVVDSGWHHQHLGGVNTAALASRGLEMLELLRRSGLKTPPGNRMERAVKALQDLNAQKLLPARDQPKTNRELTDSIRSLWQALVIIDTVRSRPDGKKVIPLPRLRPLLKGGLVERHDTHSDFANLRFETYAGAILLQAGATVAAGEPDWRLRYYDEDLGVAVKRLNKGTKSAARSLIKEAAKQVKRQGIRGMVVMNVEALIEDLPPATAPEEFGAAFNERLADLHETISSLNEYPELIAVMFLGLIGRWHFDEPRPSFHWATPQQLYGLSDVEPPERLNQFFGDHLRPRIRNALVRLTDIASGGVG